MNEPFSFTAINKETCESVTFTADANKVISIPGGVWLMSNVKIPPGHTIRGTKETAYFFESSSFVGEPLGASVVGSAIDT